METASRRAIAIDRVPALDASLGGQGAAPRQGYALSAISLFLVGLVAGCATTDTTTSLKAATTHGQPVEMAVIAEPRTAQQNGQSILGLVVQVILLDDAGNPRPSEGSMSFSMYIDDAAHAQTVEAGQQWKFSAEEVNQSAATIPLGVVHNFWLPLKGPLARAQRVKMLSAYSGPGGHQLTQWNSIHTAPKSIQFEHSSDVEELQAIADRLNGAKQPLKAP